MQILTIFLILTQWILSIYFTPQIYLFIVNNCFPKKMMDYISQQGLGLGFGLGVLLILFVISLFISLQIAVATGVLLKR